MRTNPFSQIQSHIPSYNGKIAIYMHTKVASYIIMLYCYHLVWLDNIEKLAKVIYSNVLNVKLVAELLSTSVETGPEADTITVDEDETPSNL